MRKLLVVLLAVVTLLLAACNSSGGSVDTDASGTMSIEELVHSYSIESFNDISASITWEELIVTAENGEEETYQLPEDKFFISIAPFEKVTHPCYDHSLTGCQGELVNESFDVRILDSAGNVILEETRKTMENGFIDFWLPRNDEFEVTFTQEGKVATESISTFEGDQTCITTMQLEEV